MKNITEIKQRIPNAIINQDEGTKFQDLCILKVSHTSYRNYSVTEEQNEAMKKLADIFDEYHSFDMPVRAIQSTNVAFIDGKPFAMQLFSENSEKIWEVVVPV